MSSPPPHEHPNRVERAAENAMLKLLARGAMVLAVPVILWFGAEVRKASDAILEIKGEIKALAAQLTTRVDSHEGRLSGLERRNEQQDDKIDQLQRRVYQMGAQPSPPSPTTEQLKQWRK